MKKKRVVKRIPKLRRLARNLGACRGSRRITRNMTLEEFWSYKGPLDSEFYWEFYWAISNFRRWAIRKLHITALVWGKREQQVIWGRTKPDIGLIPMFTEDPLPDWIKRKWGGYERIKRATKKATAKKVVAKKKAA